MENGVDDIPADVLRAGIDALNQFHPTDWAEGWVSAREVVRALYGAMLAPTRRANITSISQNEYRRILPASVLGEMFQKQLSMECPLSEEIKT